MDFGQCSFPLLGYPPIATLQRCLDRHSPYSCTRYVYSCRYATVQHQCYCPFSRRFRLCRKRKKPLGDSLYCDRHLDQALWHCWFSFLFLCQGQGTLCVVSSIMVGTTLLLTYAIFLPRIYAFPISWLVHLFIWKEWREYGQLSLQPTEPLLLRFLAAYRHL